MPYNQPGTVTTASWTRFATSLEETELRRGGNLHLHQNLWQIPLHSALPALAKLVHTAAAYEIPIRVLFLAAIPDWIKLPPDAKPAAESKPS